MRIGQGGAAVAAAVVAEQSAARDSDAGPVAARVACSARCCCSRLRAAVDGAEHQRRHRARARCARHETLRSRRQRAAAARSRYHLNDHDGGAGRHAAQHRRMVAARRSKDAVEAIVMNASGCGVMVKEYGHLLRARSSVCRQGAAHQRTDARPGGDPAARSQRELAQRSSDAAPAARRFSSALHPAARPADSRRGRKLLRVSSARPCCRSPRATCAAARRAPIRYCSRSSPSAARSQARPSASGATRMSSCPPTSAASLHLASGTERPPVMHWIEWLDEQLQNARQIDAGALQPR